MTDKKVEATLEQPAERTVILTMPESVARTLRQVCERIGGSANHTARSNMDLIADALDEVGVLNACHPIERGHSDAIYFAREDVSPV